MTYTLEARVDGETTHLKEYERECDARKFADIIMSAGNAAGGKIEPVQNYPNRWMGWTPKGVFAMVLTARS